MTDNRTKVLLIGLALLLLGFLVYIQFTANLEADKRRSHSIALGALREAVKTLPSEDGMLILSSESSAFHAVNSSDGTIYIRKYEPRSGECRILVITDVEYTSAPKLWDAYTYDEAINHTYDPTNGTFSAGLSLLWGDCEELKELARPE